MKKIILVSLVLISVLVFNSCGTPGAPTSTAFEPAESCWCLVNDRWGNKGDKEMDWGFVTKNKYTQDKGYAVGIADRCKIFSATEYGITLEEVEGGIGKFLAGGNCILAKSENEAEIKSKIAPHFAGHYMFTGESNQPTDTEISDSFGDFVTGETSGDTEIVILPNTDPNTCENIPGAAYHGCYDSFTVIPEVNLRTNPKLDAKYDWESYYPDQNYIPDGFNDEQTYTTYNPSCWRAIDCQGGSACDEQSASGNEDWYCIKFQSSGGATVYGWITAQQVGIQGGGIAGG